MRHRDDVLQRSGKGPTVPSWVFRAVIDGFGVCFFPITPLAALIVSYGTASSTPFPRGEFFALLAQLSAPVFLLALAYHGHREIKRRRIWRKAHVELVTRLARPAALAARSSSTEEARAVGRNGQTPCAPPGIPPPSAE